MDTVHKGKRLKGTYFYPRMGCMRVLKFCMGHYLTKTVKIHDNKIIWDLYSHFAISVHITYNSESVLLLFRVGERNLKHAVNRMTEYAATGGGKFKNVVINFKYFVTTNGKIIIME